MDISEITKEVQVIVSVRVLYNNGDSPDKLRDKAVCLVKKSLNNKNFLFKPCVRFHAMDYIQ